MDVAGNDISDAGAVALAKALESGQCQLETLNLSSESTLILAFSCVAVVACFFQLRALVAGVVRAREYVDAAAVRRC